MNKLESSPCPACGRTDKAEDALACPHCGAQLDFPKRHKVFVVQDICIGVAFLGYVLQVVAPELAKHLMGAGVALYGIIRLIYWDRFK